MESIFFTGWSELFRVIAVGTLAYVAIVFMLRAAGKRALTKMSAYDLVVTVALGSSLATALLSPQMTLDRAVVGFGVLLGLQRLVAWLSMRWRWAHELVNNEPRLVVLRGRALQTAMRQENLTPEDVEAAVRSQGKAGLEEVDAVVLETDGSFSVIPDLRGELQGRLQRQVIENKAPGQ